MESRNGDKDEIDLNIVENEFDDGDKGVGNSSQRLDGICPSNAAEDLGESLEEIVTLDMSGSNCKSVDIRTGSVDAESVAAIGEDLATKLLNLQVGETLFAADFSDKLDGGFGKYAERLHALLGSIGSLVIVLSLQCLYQFSRLVVLGLCGEGGRERRLETPLLDGSRRRHVSSDLNQA